MDGLIIKEPYIDWILKGDKTIELRGSDTSKRGRIALIKSGTGKIYGTVELVRTFKIETAQYEALRIKHCVGAERRDIKYKNLWAWELSNVEVFEEPVPYEHKLGQQVWVKNAYKER